MSGRGLLNVGLGQGPVIVIIKSRSHLVAKCKPTFLPTTTVSICTMAARRLCSVLDG